MQPSILTGFHHLILEPSGTGVGIGSLADAWSKLPLALAKAGAKNQNRDVEDSGRKADSFSLRDSWRFFFQENCLSFVGGIETWLWLEVKISVITWVRLQNCMTS